LNKKCAGSLFMERDLLVLSVEIDERGCPERAFIFEPVLISYEF
jgi:hypothetical protein